MSANHISTVRQHLLDQLQALRSASTLEEVKTELERSRGISELAQVCVNTAKVEVDYLEATGQTSTPFLEVPPDAPYITDDAAPRNGISSITRHRLQG
jgi:hypothetical protein